VDDRFCDGSPWQIGLDRWPGAQFELSLLPLPLPEGGLPIFMEPAAKALGGGAGVRGASLRLTVLERVLPLEA
jgi:hypothetical protein